MRVVVMGVSGSGKTTVGSALAERLGLPFVDADEFHLPTSIEKLRAGVPLTDDDRWSWLDELNRRLRDHPDGMVLACSALTPAHRGHLRRDVDDLRFVLLDAPPEVIARRLARRTGHVAGPALLASQLELLDPPPDAIVLQADRRVPDIVAAALAALTED